MHQHHHALLCHDKFKSSSIHVAPCIYVPKTQPFKYTCILELSSTTIWPNEMTVKWYIHSYHMIIEQFKAMLHIMDVMPDRHLCRSDFLSVSHISLHCYLAHVDTWYAPLCSPAMSDSIDFVFHFVVVGCNFPQS